MISKSHVHKYLEIKPLQNALYGRLAIDGALAQEADRGFGSHLAKPGSGFLGESGVLLVANLMLEIAVSIRNLFRVRYALD